MVLSVEIGIIPWIPCNGYVYIYTYIYIYLTMIFVTHDLLVTLSGEVGMIFSQADLMISLGNDLLGQEMKLPKHQTYRIKVRINKTNSSSQRLSGKCQVNLGVWAGIQALTLLCSKVSQVLSQLLLSVCGIAYHHSSSNMFITGHHTTQDSDVLSI